MNELFCVLHKNPGYSSKDSAAFIAGERCIDLPEAAAAVRASPGFLLENASLGKASAFNLRASANGFETVLLSHKDLKNPPPALTVSKIELKTEGFYYVCAGAREHVSFEAVRMIAACAFDIEVPPKEPAAMEAGLIGSLRARYFPFALPIGDKYNKPPSAPPPPPRETVFLADIFTGGPAPLRLNVPCDEQDYSGIGPKKTVSSLENFRILLDELSALAFGTCGNAFLEALLKKEPLGPLKYPSAQAYEKELVWLATILPPKSE